MSTNTRVRVPANRSKSAGVKASPIRTRSCTPLSAARAVQADAPLAAPYLLPLAARVRALFKMDAAQAVYIGELRTGEGGHFSYRQIAWEMYEALRERAPALAALARPTALTDPPDLLRR